MQQITKLFSLFTKVSKNCSVFLHNRIFTRETVWVLVVSIMLLLIFVLGTMGVQPRFVYSGF